jgi:hypothetical protein
MSYATFLKFRFYFTGLVAMSIWSLLAWNYYHGGIPSHHILADKDLPEISNLWGAILLPLLAWLLSYRVQKRMFSQNNQYAELTLINYAMYAFTISLVYGAITASLFSYGYDSMTGIMLLGTLVLALFFKVYYAECLLGFVIGMTMTFGAVLPTVTGAILASIAFLLFRGIRPAVLYLVSRIKGT